MARQWATIRLKDAYGRQTSIRREMDDQLLLVDYVAEISLFVDELLAITDLGLVDASFHVTGLEDATDPAAGANVDVGATFQGYGEGEDAYKKLTTKVPGITLSFVDSNGMIDVTQTEIAAFLANYSTSPFQWKISDGEKVGTWIQGTLDK
jgi:hypothetical protein